MNTIIKTSAIMLLTCVLHWTARAQDNYESAMAAALQTLAEALQPADFTALGNRFEQIGNTATDQWTPLYYAAYCQLVAGISQQNADEKDRFFEKALNLVESAEKRQADNSEIYALKGYTQFMQMSVDPQNRLDLISEAEAALGKAMQLDPSNPRPYFIKGQNTFYTPEFFGGGAKAAKPLLEQAKEKFDTFKRTEKFAPNWGKEQCAYLLQQAANTDTQ
ncbi:hypothetical protein JHJ32_18815 [Parapedobacter sp. ISTM3]|uniref:hypothetical protein n=1 Tax=Parapedobacter sp. ISTM3 TaxID=2800130 RepID=UPI001905ED7A|nr:hypothetical protein [Parapedobacter sp. ISTM3]MBK1442056.1 hypothetical protein [Parapedobacter sp. ISTM3]